MTKYIPMIFVGLIIIAGLTAGIYFYPRENPQENLQEDLQETPQVIETPQPIEAPQIEIGEGGFKVSVAIQTFDKDGIRSKKGDIIAVKPAGWKWGDKEYEQYLIVEIDLGTSITTWEDAQKLTVPMFETGELWWPSSEDKDGNQIEPPKTIGKRRYKIDFADLNTKAQSKGISLDFNKISGDKTVYQPLEKTAISVDSLITDKVLNKKLDSTQLTIIKNIGK